MQELKKFKTSRIKYNISYNKIPDQIRYKLAEMVEFFKIGVHRQLSLKRCCRYSQNQLFYGQDYPQNIQEGEEAKEEKHLQKINSADSP